MPLKQPKKLRTKAKTAQPVLEDLIRTAHGIPDNIAVLDSAAKLTKALKIPSNVADSERLIRLLKRSMEIREIPKYVDFIKDEWLKFNSFVANYGLRGLTETMPYTLNSLCLNHSIFISLFKTYTNSVTEYNKRLGNLDDWEAKAERVKEDPQAEIKRLKQEIVRYKNSLDEATKEAYETRVQMTRFKQSYLRARRFALYFQQHISSSISNDAMLDYLEEGKKPEVGSRWSFLFS